MSLGHAQIGLRRAFLASIPALSNAKLPWAKELLYRGMTLRNANSA